MIAKLLSFTTIPRFWAKIVEILLLIAPFILAFLGVDIGEGIEVFEQIGVLVGALIIAVKNLVQIVLGYFSVGGGVSFKEYRAMSQQQYEIAKAT